MLLIFHLALPLHLSLLRYLEADEDESNEDEEIIEELSDDDVVNDEDQEEEEVLDEDYEEITNELDPNFKGEIWLPLCMLKKCSIAYLEFIILHTGCSLNIVFFRRFFNIPDSGFSLFSLGVSVCTHTRQVENQRCSRTGRVQKNQKF